MQRQQQRLALVEDTFAFDKIKSHIVKHTLELWALGKYSSAEVQKIIKSTHDDLLQFAKLNRINPTTISDGIAKVASFGAFGKYPGKRSS